MIEPRKLIFHQETIFGEMDARADKPSIRVAASAVDSNPFAGRFVQDLSELFDLGGALGEQLSGKLTELAGAPIVSVGKAAILGGNGEFELGGEHCLTARRRVGLSL